MTYVARDVPIYSQLGRIGEAEVTLTRHPLAPEAVMRVLTEHADVRAVLTRHQLACLMFEVFTPSDLLDLIHDHYPNGVPE